MDPISSTSNTTATTDDQYITIPSSSSSSTTTTKRQGYQPAKTPDIYHVGNGSSDDGSAVKASTATTGSSGSSGRRFSDMQQQSHSSSQSVSTHHAADVTSTPRRRGSVAANQHLIGLYPTNHSVNKHVIGSTTATSTAATNHGLPHTSIYAQPSPELSPSHNPFKFPFKAAYDSDSSSSDYTAVGGAADMRKSSSNMSTGSSTFYDSSVSSSPLLMQQQQSQQQQQQQPQSHRHHESTSHRRAIPSLSSAVPPVTSPTVGKHNPYSAVQLGTGNTPLGGSFARTAAASQQSFWDTPTAWIIYYFIANLSLTLYNKLMMNKFPFPWALTGIHTLCGTIGSQAALSKGLFTQQRLTGQENLVLFAFSSLYTINIAVSNLSLNLVTVPFHQVVRAMTPLFTIVLSTILLNKRSSRAVYISLIPIVMGVVFATYGDYYFTAWGFILTLIGTLLAAMKTVATNMILVGRLKLHPLDLLIRMSPLAFIQCVFASWWTGELAKVREFGATQMDTSKYVGLIINGGMAFFLNVVSFTANKKTSALTMTVAANVKQVLTIVLAVLIFHLHITPTNFFGITLTLIGGAAYARVEYMAKLAKVNASPAIGSSNEKPQSINNNRGYQQFAGHIPPPMHGDLKVPLSPLPVDMNEKRYYEKQ